MTPVRSAEWEFLPETAWPEVGEVRTALRNLYTGQCLVYRTRGEGINLGWSLGPPRESVTLAGQNGRVAFGERLAIRVEGGDYLRYEVRDSGINLGWAADEVFEWEVHDAGLAVGCLRPRLRVAIWNIVENDYLVYSERRNGINLRWSEDATARQSIAAHLYLGDHPRLREASWTSNCQGLSHDATHWYISQTDHLWRVPVSEDLSILTAPDAGLAIRRSDHPPGVYNHYGDPSYGAGYLWVPLENTDDESIRPALFAYDPSALSPIQENQLYRQSSAPWCAVDPSGEFVYSSNGLLDHGEEKDAGRLRRYPIDGSSLGPPELGPVLRDEDGAPLFLDSMQGGVFASPDRLYLSNGYYTGDPTTWGVHLFDLGTGRRLARSSTTDREFTYRFLQQFDHEPEGLTWWDLDDGRAPGIRGQLHVVLLDNDDWPNGSDDVSIKHYRVARRQLLLPGTVAGSVDVTTRLQGTSSNLPSAICMRSALVSHDSRMPGRLLFWAWCP